MADTYIKPGESQTDAIKRYMRSRRAEWRSTPKRSYPKYELAMTAAEYIRRYQALNNHNQLLLLPFQIDTITGASHIYDPSFPEVVEEKIYPRL